MMGQGVARADEPAGGKKNGSYVAGRSQDVVKEVA
jgi:hypothetical protein